MRAQRVCRDFEVHGGWPTEWPAVIGIQRPFELSNTRASPQGEELEQVADDSAGRLASQG